MVRSNILKIVSRILRLNNLKIHSKQIYLACSSYHKAAVPYLSDNDTIINTTSVTAYRGSGHLIDYASTKGAIVSFTRSLATTLMEKNIRVNGVAPGPIYTPLIPATFDEDKVENQGGNTPMGRRGQPAELAPAYVFLCYKCG